MSLRGFCTGRNSRRRRYPEPSIYIMDKERVPLRFRGTRSLFVIRTCAAILSAFWLLSAGRGPPSVLNCVVVACNPQRIAALRRLVRNDGYCAITASLFIAQVLNRAALGSPEGGKWYTSSLREIARVLEKENIGNFKNTGTEYRPVGQPRTVLDHDFSFLNSERLLHTAYMC